MSRVPEPSATPGNILEMQILHPTLDLLNQTLWGGMQNSVLTSPPRGLRLTIVKGSAASPERTRVEVRRDEGDDLGTANRRHGWE